MDCCRARNSSPEPTMKPLCEIATMSVCLRRRAGSEWRCHEGKGVGRIVGDGRIGVAVREANGDERFGAPGNERRWKWRRRRATGGGGVADEALGVDGSGAGWVSWTFTIVSKKICSLQDRWRLTIAARLAGWRGRKQGAAASAMQPLSTGDLGASDFDKGDGLSFFIWGPFHRAGERISRLNDTLRAVNLRFALLSCVLLHRTTELLTVR